MTDTKAIELEAHPNEGIFGILHRAAELIGRWPSMLVLELTEPDNCGFMLEATLSEQLSKRTVERLDLRVRTRPQLQQARPTLIRALREFGGTDFTSVTLGASDRELTDTTIAFGKVPLLARNICLFTNELGTHRRDVERVLEALGVHCKESNGNLEVPKYQLRAGLNESAQVEAFDEITSGPFDHCVLYGSPLPPARSIRIELTADGPLSETLECRLDLTLSRGWARGASLSPSEAETMQRLIYDPALGLSPSGLFRVSLPGARPNEPYRPRAVLGHRPRTEYSVNWGTKRR